MKSDPMPADGPSSLLVTTALEESWGRERPVVFLGEWCRRYTRREAWRGRPHSVLAYHWDDGAKFESDSAYLRLVYERVLVALGSALNRHHGLQHDLRYWRIIVGPWLLQFIPTIFDRWECVRTALKALPRPIRTISLVAPSPRVVAFDVTEFTGLVVDDVWNYFVFLELLDLMAGGEVEILRTDGEAKAALPRPTPPLARSKLGALDRLLDRWLPFPRAALIASYFPVGRLALLNLSLGQAPRTFTDAFAHAQPGRGWIQGTDRGLDLDYESSTPFEAYLVRRLVQDIPVAYVEAFQALRASALKNTASPRVVMTASCHWWNEPFKLWSAERAARGTRLVIANHGGSLPHRNSAWFHEEEISDIKVVWSDPFHPRHRKLPPQFGAVVSPRRTRSRERTSMLWVATDFPRYAFRCQSLVQGGQGKTLTEFPIDFHDHLPEALRPAFRVRPFRTGHQGWWDQDDWLRDRLGAAVTDTREPISHQMRQAKLIISGYPETFYNEAMASGLPTLLVYPRQWWKLRPEAETLVDMLHDNGMAFWCPREAAKHVECIWDDIDGWWLSSRIARGRDAMLRYARSEGRHFLRPWRRLLLEASGGRAGAVGPGQG